MELRDAKERQRLRELQAKEAERQRAQMRDELVTIAPCLLFSCALE